MPNLYRKAVDRYLGWLAVACLITLPYLGIGAVVIWGLTALTLYGFIPSLERRKRPRHRPNRPCRRKKGSRPLKDRNPPS